MKISNSFKFFQQAFGLKAVTVDHQSYLVAFDDEAVPECTQFERSLSACRNAVLSALYNKLGNKMAPVFSQTDITPQFRQKHKINYVMVLLESLELTCLAQAIIDDDRATVTAMLDKKPELLLFKPDVIVTSEYTGQRFSVDGNFLGLACRRKQIEMVKIITPYFDKLQADDEQSIKSAEIKNAGLAQWKEYQTNAIGDIQVRADYQAIIDDLIAVFKSEDIISLRTYYRILPENIETAMESLYNRLVPDFKEEDISKRDVFNKQNHLDIELLLYAAYKAYDTHFELFKTGPRRDAFCIRVIGILQNFLPPETAKIFCEGFYEVEQQDRAVSDRAAGLKLKDGTSFYAGSDFAVRAGLGFEFLASSQNGVLAAGGGWGQVPLRNLCQTKTTIFRELYTPRTAPNPSTGPRT